MNIYTLYKNPPPPLMPYRSILLKRPRMAGGFRVGRPLLGDRGVLSDVAPLFVADE